MPRLSLLPLTLVSAFLLAGCDRQSAEPAQPQENSAGEKASELTGTLDRSFAGEPIPAMSFADPQGMRIDLAAIGKPVLLNLWATWCAPCVIEMPMLDALAEGTKGQLRVVTISQDFQPEKVAPFFAERDFDHLEPWLDPETELSTKFGGGGAVLPTTVLYSADGKEIWRVVGGFDWSSDEARALVNEALGEEGAQQGT